MQFALWDIFLKPSFLFTFLLVLGGFGPIAYSIFRTWEEAVKEEKQP